MTPDPAITPDSKDWTWVITTTCPECGFDAAAFDKIPFFLGVGGADTNVDDTPRAWDPYIGTTRIARAQSFERTLTGIGLDSSLLEVQPGRYNAIGILKGTGGGKSLAFNGHIDTNPITEGWTVDPIGGVAKDDCVYGIGVSNMKAGDRAYFRAVETLIDARGAAAGRRDPDLGQPRGRLQVAPVARRADTAGQDDRARGVACEVGRDVDRDHRKDARVGRRAYRTCYGRS